MFWCRLPNKFLLDVCYGWCASHMQQQKKRKKRKFLALLPPFNVTYLITVSHAACVWCTVLVRSTCGPCNSTPMNQKMRVKEEASSKNRYLIRTAAIKCVPLFGVAEKTMQAHTKVKSCVKKKAIQNVCAANTHGTHFHFLWRGKNSYFS